MKSLLKGQAFFFKYCANWTGERLKFTCVFNSELISLTEQFALSLVHLLLIIEKLLSMKAEVDGTIIMRDKIVLIDFVL